MQHMHKDNSNTSIDPGFRVLVFAIEKPPILIRLASGFVAGWFGHNIIDPGFGVLVFATEKPPILIRLASGFVAGWFWHNIRCTV